MAISSISPLTTSSKHFKLKTSNISSSMESALSLTFKPTPHHPKTPFFNPLNNFNLIKPNPPYPLLKPSKQPTTIALSATTKPDNNPITRTLKNTARTIVFTAVAAAAVISKFQQCPAVAEPITQTVITTEPEFKTRVTEFVESNSETIESIKTLLEKNLETGEDGDRGDRLERILTESPLSFEALFEHALVMDRFGEGETVIKRLEKEVEEDKHKETRDVRLIIAQVEYLKKNVDEALKRYDELVNEDPNDFRPYFCKGVIYSLVNKNDEAKAQFAKYGELSPKKLEVQE